MLACRCEHAINPKTHSHHDSQPNPHDMETVGCEKSVKTAHCVCWL